MRQRTWTEEEVCVIAETLDHSAKDVAAQIGRTASQVHSMRTRMRKGWSKSVFPWSAEEDAVLLECGMALTAEQIARRLPGRSAVAVRSRRAKLDMGAGPGGSRLSPRAIASRRLLAKTCGGCGLLLSAKWFLIDKSTGGAVSWCRSCCSLRAQNNNTNKQRVPGASKWHRAITDLTRKQATRCGFPYLSSDHQILEDENLSLLSKAIKTSRTYTAVVNACSRYGYESLGTRLGSAALEAWSIDNPNADRIEEITAALKQEFTEAGVTFPEWDWDDEYTTKETAV